VTYAVAADHAGAELKRVVGAALAALGHDVVDLGGDGGDPADDYPDYAERAGEAVRRGRAERAVLVCGSGVGAAVAANKLPGVRAGLCHDTYSARQGVEHDDVNVLVLGARVIGVELARELVAAFASARFSGEERHARRLAKIRALEAGFASRAAEDGGCRSG
jgi:ribose 5-phosphate isomerase B